LLENSHDSQHASILIVEICIKVSCNAPRASVTVFGSTILLTLGMEIYAANSTLALIEADIVEALEARPTNSAYTVIRYEEVFLPPHKNILSLCQTLNVEVSLPRLLLKRTKGVELGPMLQIYFIS
jgi:hypothetical protein